MTRQNPQAPRQDVQIILASSSKYRRELLERLGLNFKCISPDIDESRQTDESPPDYVLRLAQEKAHVIAKQHPEAIVIGSDQCAVVDNEIMGKPHTQEKAFQQLRQAASKPIEFLTGVCVEHINKDRKEVFLEPFTVKFRDLSDSEIERYIAIEQPLDCAGSFKSEGLGIALTSAMLGEDPTALIGLPLIKLADILREFNVLIP